MILKYFPLLIVVVFSFIAGFTLLHKGLHPTHDGEYHIIRFYEFNKSIMDGNYYPRWAPDLNNGYGVPLFNYVYPLPNYLAFLSHQIGISFIDSFKLQMFFAGIIVSIFFYLFSKEYWGKWGGVVSSVFYTFAPYHFVDVYVRGSIGEVWALTFFPGFLWSVTKCFKNFKTKWFIISIVFLSFTVFSHNILGLMFFIFGICYMLFLVFNNKVEIKISFLYVLGIVLFTLLLTSIFWLPAIFEQKYVTGLQIYSVANNFPDLFQLLIPSWGTGFSEGSLGNQMSFQIGIANLLAVLIGFIAFFKSLSIRKNRGILAFFLLSFVFTFFILLKQSEALWNSIPFMNYFQFPWRFLSLMMIITGFLAGGIVVLTKNKFLIFGLILFSVIVSYGYTKVAYFHNRDDSYYINRSNFIDGTNSPGNFFNTIWMNAGLKKNPNIVTSLKGKLEYEVNQKKTGNYVLSVSQDISGPALLSIAYFPGWKVWINEKQAKITYNKDGLIYLFLPKGKSKVLVNLDTTYLQNVGEVIFLFSCVSIIVLFTNLHWIKEKNENSN